MVVTKIDAARRHLCTAIQLWFTDGDPVSTHVLAFSSYEILHYLAKRRGVKGLLYDPPGIAKEGRQKLAQAFKAAASFFKHADHDHDQSLEFEPRLTEGFIVYSIVALQRCDEPPNKYELAFVQWDRIHNPQRFPRQPGELDQESVHGILRNLSKREFFELFMQVDASGSPP